MCPNIFLMKYLLTLNILLCNQTLQIKVFYILKQNSLEFRQKRNINYLLVPEVQFTK